MAIFRPKLFKSRDQSKMAPKFTTTLNDIAAPLPQEVQCPILLRKSPNRGMGPILYCDHTHFLLLTCPHSSVLLSLVSSRSHLNWLDQTGRISLNHSIIRLNHSMVMDRSIRIYPVPLRGRHGGLVVSALDPGSNGPGSSPGRVIVLCSWARHFTLTVPLSTQEYKWAPANCQGKPTKYWGMNLKPAMNKHPIQEE